MSHIRVTRSFGSGGCLTWPVVVVPLTHLWSVLSFLGQIMGDQLTFLLCLPNHLFSLPISFTPQWQYTKCEILVWTFMYVVLFQKYVWPKMLNFKVASLLGPIWPMHVCPCLKFPGTQMSIRIELVKRVIDNFEFRLLHWVKFPFYLRNNWNANLVTV